MISSEVPVSFPVLFYFLVTWCLLFCFLKCESYFKEILKNILFLILICKLLNMEKFFFNRNIWSVGKRNLCGLQQEYQQQLLTVCSSWSSGKMHLWMASLQKAASSLSRLTSQHPLRLYLSLEFKLLRTRTRFCWLLCPLHSVQSPAHTLYLGVKLFQIFS